MKGNLRAYLALLSFVFAITLSSSSFAAILGDYNQDGVVDLQEAMYALQVSAGVYPTLDPSCLLDGKGPWATGTNYEMCDVVEHGGTFYAAQQNHTSETGTNQPPNDTYWAPLFFMGPPPIFITGNHDDEGMIATTNLHQNTRARLSHARAAVMGEYSGGFESGEEPGGSLGTAYEGMRAQYGNTGPNASIANEFAAVSAAFDNTGNTGPSANIAFGYPDDQNPEIVHYGAFWGSYSISAGGPFGGIGNEYDGVHGSYSDAGPHGQLGTDYAGVAAHYSYDGGPNAVLATIDNALYGSYSASGPAASIGTETMAIYAVFSQLEDGTPTGPNVELGSSTHAINAQGEVRLGGLPTSPPPGSVNAGVVCVTTAGDLWLDNDGTNDCAVPAP